MKFSKKIKDFKVYNLIKKIFFKSFIRNIYFNLNPWHNSSKLRKLEKEIALLKSKYENMDLGDFKDLDDVVAALRSGALDLDNICKLIPNFEEEPGGIGFALKGVPTSFPEIDPVALLKGGKLPDFPKSEFDLEVEAITKEATDEFLQFDLPKFGF